MSLAPGSRTGDHCRMLLIHGSFIVTGTGPAEHHDDRDREDDREGEEIHHNSCELQVIPRELVRRADTAVIEVALVNFGHGRPPDGIDSRSERKKTVIMTGECRLTEKQAKILSTLQQPQKFP